MRCFNPVAYRMSISLIKGAHCQQLSAHGRHLRTRQHHPAILFALGITHDGDMAIKQGLNLN